jgi:hypothetical protein
MRDIEEYVRFKFAKYSSCYIDILRHFLASNGLNELINNIPDLHIWLEFGVSQKTQLSLISLGLSRQTSISLSNFIAQDSLNKEECLLWLANNDLSSLQLSPIMISEIDSAIQLPR